MNKGERKWYFNKLSEHIGHNIVIVKYVVDEVSPAINISIECEDCAEVLIDFEEEM